MVVSLTKILVVLQRMEVVAVDVRTPTAGILVAKGEKVACIPIHYCQNGSGLNG